MSGTRTSRNRGAGRAAAVLTLAVLAVAGCRGLLGISDSTAEPSEGGADEAGADSGARDSGPPFCATKFTGLLLCADFDNQDSVEKGWDNKKNGTADFGISGKGTIGDDTTIFFGGFRSAQLHLPPLLTSSDHGSAYLMKQLSTTPEQLQIDLQMHIVTEQYPKGGGGRAVLVYASYLPGGSVNVVRDTTGTALWVSVGNPPVNTVIPFKGGDLVPGKWSRLQIAIDNRPIYDGGVGDIEVVLDGLPVANAPSPKDYQVSGPQEIDIGPLARGTIGELTVNVDNVLLLLPK